MTFTQAKHYRMAAKIFKAVLKYYPNAQFYETIQGSEQAVIVAHWFDIDEAAGKHRAEAIQKAMEKFLVRAHFEDEVAECDKCGTAVEMQPTHWGWQPDFIQSEDADLICRDCVEQADEDDLEDMLQSYINVVSAVPDWVKKDLQRLGFVCLEDDEMACARFESGFHPHQTDDPHKVAKHIREELPDHDFAIAINSVGQFDVNWSVWIRNPQ